MNCYIIISDREVAILENIKKKQEQMDEMQHQMTALMMEVTMSEIKHTTRITTNYKPEKDMELPSFLREVG